MARADYISGLSIGNRLQPARLLQVTSDVSASGRCLGYDWVMEIRSTEMTPEDRKWARTKALREIRLSTELGYGFLPAELESDGA